MDKIPNWMNTLLGYVGSFLLALFIVNFIIVNARVPSGSMENTIMEGDRIFGSRLTYLYKSPERGDVIVFKYPDDESVYFTKRVIGLPGETIEGKKGNVYIDGVKLSEPYIKEKMEGNFGPFKIPDGCYFMLGDNRNNSLDSRFWKNKFVKKSAIIGKLYLRYFPVTKISIIK